jgi:hypothetical protein
MAMLKVMTNCAAGIPPIVPNTSTASVTSSWKDANDPHATCQRTSASTISNYVASNNRKELQHQGYHFLDNATNVHPLQKGWITVTLDVFYKIVLTKKPKEFLDVLAGQISGLLSHQSDCDYP